MHKAIAYLLFLCLSVTSFAQSDDAEIRRLEDMERDAIQKGDTAVLQKLLSRQIVVHNPENTIVGLEEIMARIRSGKINYAKFERSIEKITFINGIAIVMGMELLTPQGTTQNAGKLVHRRFTNIWTKEQNEWKLSARQSTIIRVQ